MKRNDKVYGDVRCITMFLKSIEDAPELIIEWNKRTVTLNFRNKQTRVDKHKKYILRSLYRLGGLRPREGA